MIRKRIPKDIRKLVFEIYNHRCVECGESDRRLLQIHHIDKNPNNNSIENLELLCIWDHMMRHPGGGLIMNLFCRGNADHCKREKQY